MVRIEKMPVNSIDKELICDFLAWLADERKCGVSTQNQRLAATHAFFRFIQMEEPKYLLTAQSILAIPFKQANKSMIHYLSTDGIRIILAQPDMETRLGYRDFVLLTLMYDTGARVQEIADLTVGDVIFDKPPYIRLTGKGRKTRLIPLMKETEIIIKKYIQSYSFADTRKISPLFTNRSEQKLTRAGLSYILGKYVNKARSVSPHDIPATITPHCIRHSKAMHLLQAGVNLVYIRDFLGHSDIKTTEIYARADSHSKRKALENAYENLAPPFDKSWQDDQSLMSWLKSL